MSRAVVLLSLRSSVEGNECCYGGEHCEKSKEHDACRDSQQAVFLDLGVGPPQDVFPTSPRNLARMFRVASATRFARANYLYPEGLVFGRGVVEDGHGGF